ncbi:MAG: hypothetical protein JSR27_02425 [Proteobacteria bacterium]|nr:hypothetical protein [Pseudomonadota bacterium]
MRLAIRLLALRLAVAALPLLAGSAYAFDVTVNTAATSGGSWVGGVFTPTAAGATVNANEVVSRLATGAVVITATDGDALTVNAALNWGANTLTLQAGGDIRIEQAMSLGATAGLALQYGQNAVAAANTARYRIDAPVDLAAGASYGTRLGNDGSTINYTIITSLGGAGSTTGSDLQGMQGNLAGAYALGTNIDAGATGGWSGGFAPVGNATTKFTGHFDGLGHAIDGLSIQGGGNDNIGLFGYAGNGAFFANLGLSNADITGRAFVGTLLGRGNYATIDNAWSSGTVATTSTSTTLGGVGGLVGGADNSTIANSHSSATVHGFISVGGLVGQMGTSDATGGASRISNSWTTGDVIADSGYGGGLVGRSYAYIANSHATGNVSGGKVTANGISALGGLVGFGAGSSSMSDPQYLNVYATGNVTGTGNDVGGLVGLMEGEFVMHNAFATGNVQGNNAVGGLIGRLTNSGGVQSQAKLYTVYTQGGTVTGNNFVGGLIGQSFFVGINSSYVASGAVTGTGDQVGGVIGGIDCTCNAGAISTSEGVVWNYETTGQLNPMGKKLTAPYDNLVDPISWTAAEGPDYLLVGSKFIGANTAQMMTLDPYKTVGWFLGQYGLSYFIVTAATAAGRDYSDSVYLTNTWFLYEGNTYPLLRGYLTPIIVTANSGSKVYDGTPDSPLGVTYSYTPDARLKGTPVVTADGSAVGVHTIILSGGIYSDQFGYEAHAVPGTLTILPSSDLIFTNGFE